MYVRILTGRVKPYNADLFGRVLTDDYVPLIRQLPGFQHFYFGIERSTWELVAVMLWDRVPPDDQIMEIGEPFLDQLRALGAELQPWHEYEILTSG
ncbi:MAG TPA: hypothetical protein VFU72_11400 [Nitrolancea sp.]|nr:hypothetical protein [Nitrolancea sp.]